MVKRYFLVGTRSVGNGAGGNWLVKVMALALTMLACAANADYTDHPEARSFVDKMVAEHDFDRSRLIEWLAQARQQTSVLEAIARPAERVRQWHEYRPMFLNPQRIVNGAAFWKTHRSELERAEKTFGVPAEIIVAIIGVETNFGRNMGSHGVFEALSTLAFDYPPRSDFFRRELEHYLLLIREQEQNPLAFKGSYAGAMGYGQFMPSSYRQYAVDFSRDGFSNIWENPVDAIGSVANYLQAHGWEPDAPVLVRARPKGKIDPDLLNKIDRPDTSVARWRERGLKPLQALSDDRPVQALRLEGDYGEEFWLGTQNFYVITRYNRSHMYALAVYQLSQEIRKAMEKEN